MGNSEELRIKEDHFGQIQKTLGVKCEQTARFLDISVDLMCVTTDKGQFVAVNKAWEEKLGYTPQELEGKYARDFIHPDDIQRTEGHFLLTSPVNNKLLCDGFVNRYRTKGGDYRYLEWRSHMIGCMLYSSARDISGLKQAEAEDLKLLRKLELSNRKQRVMIDISAMFIGAVTDNFKEVVNSSLAMIGETLEADRVYIFFYDFKAGIAINEFEWCNDGIIPQIDNLQSTPLDDTKEWVETHLRGETIFVPSVSALRLQDNTRPIMEKQGIKSMLLVPLNFDELFRGFVGIDSVKKELSFTRDDEKFLKEYGYAFVSTKYRIVTQEKLTQSEELMKSTLFSIGDGVISTDLDGKITMMNHVAEKLTGYSESEAIGLDFDVVFNIHNEITGEKTMNIVAQVISKGERVELRENTILKSKNGGIVEIEENAAPIIDAGGKIAGAVVVFRDCSERKEKQRIEYLSMRDHLTGLYNRRYIDIVLPIIDNSDNYPLAVIYADINGLKLTNDAFGHQTGDRLIRKVSDILKKSTRSADVIGRIGGDEFIVIIPCTDEEKASFIKARIQAMAAGELLDNVVVSIAIGFSIKSDNSCTIEEVLKIAEENMYRDKLHLGKIMRSQTLDIIISNLNKKYDYEEIHSKVSAQIAEALARKLGLGKKEIIEIKAAAELHDIGKIVISPELLSKPEKLTRSEFETVKQHSEAGYNILKSVFENADFSEAALYHHERWDGTGYPQGLAGKNIPLASRIVSIAGAYEAMTGERSYKPSMTIKEAVDELWRCSGTQFDPEMVLSFIELVEENRLA